MGRLNNQCSTKEDMNQAHVFVHGVNDLSIKQKRLLDSLDDIINNKSYERYFMSLKELESLESTRKYDWFEWSLYLVAYGIKKGIAFEKNRAKKSNR